MGASSSVKPRHLLAISDLSVKEIKSLIEQGLAYKKNRQSGQNRSPLRGKVLGLLFEKASTRTRVSFEVAMSHLGGSTIFLSMDDLQIQRGESVQDTANVLSRYLDGLVIRTFGQATIEGWADSASIPVINGLTDLHHPCQALGDLMTIQERFGSLKGLKLAYVGDGNNVAHSLIEAGCKVGMTISLASPRGFQPEPAIVEQARRHSIRYGGGIELSEDPKEAVNSADVVYTDVWVSMGWEREAKKRLQKLKPYQVNDQLLSAARAHAVVMHCLPAHRGQEITASVMDGPRSIIWDQAENRLHIQKAILNWLLGENT